MRSRLSGAAYCVRMERGDAALSVSASGVCWIGLPWSDALEADTAAQRWSGSLGLANPKGGGCRRLREKGCHASSCDFVRLAVEAAC